MNINNKLKAVAVEAAIASGQLLKSRLGRIKKLSFKDSGTTNIVTDVDKKSEEMIIKKIKAAFPLHHILAEESGRNHIESEYSWFIDPLDGTTNFVHSFPFFCVSIAVQRAGRIITGVVYDPMREELFLAEEGRPSSLNRRRIKVSPVNKIRNSLLATGFAYDVNKSCAHDNIDNFARLLKASQAIRRAGSAALDLCYVACGRFEGYWELDLKPWDTAAASFIVQQAGGKVTRFNGAAHSPYDKNILATNGRIHKDMIKVLKGSCPV
ncbi:MAG: inositol monophosphatase family protein [bacterium]